MSKISSLVNIEIKPLCKQCGGKRLVLRIEKSPGFFVWRKLTGKHGRILYTVPEGESVTATVVSCPRCFEKTPLLSFHP